MVNLFRALGTAAVGAALVSAGAAFGAPTTSAGNAVIAKVNGQPITQEDLQVYTQQRNGGKPADDSDKGAIIDEMVTRELLYQEAVAQGIDKNPQVASAIRQETHTLLANVAIQDLLQSKQPSEEELRAAYKSHIKTMGHKEYHARHILLKTEDEAKAVIARLDKGEDFTALAKEKSIGPSGKDGGDLGWFGPDSMVKPFAAATEALKVGAYTETPVHTQFGWHVIKLEKTRDVQPPSFEGMKPQLLNTWRSKMIQAYLDSLRSKAKVTITGDSGK